MKSSESNRNINSNTRENFETETKRNSNHHDETVPPPPPTPTTTDAKPQTTPAIPWRISTKIYTWFVRNSPGLVGWNDDDVRELRDRIRRRRRERAAIDGDSYNNGGGGGVGGSEEDEQEAVSEDGGGGLAAALFEGEKRTLVETETPEQVWADIADMLGDKLVEYFWKSQKLHQSLESLPNNENDVRKTRAYETVLNAVKGQRDRYIVGQEYAEMKESERAKEHQSFPKPANANAISNVTLEIPMDPAAFPLSTLNPSPSTATTTTSSSSSSTITTPLTTTKPQTTALPLIYPNSLAAHQLVSILHPFLHSPPVHAVVLPYALYALAPPRVPPYNLPDGGAIYGNALRSVVTMVPSAQDITNTAVKGALMGFLSDDGWREWVKRQAAGGVVSKLPHVSVNVDGMEGSGSGGSG